MDLILVGIAVAFNILVVLWKLQNERLLDGVIDGLLLATVAVVFSGSTAALIIGTVGSALVSLYLLFKPIKVSL